MIKPICDRCGKELKEFGALLFSPLDKHDRVMKYHICKECFWQLPFVKNKMASEFLDNLTEFFINCEEFMSKKELRKELKEEGINLERIEEIAKYAKRNWNKLRKILKKKRKSNIKLYKEV